MTPILLSFLARALLLAAIVVFGGCEPSVRSSTPRLSPATVAHLGLGSRLVPNGGELGTPSVNEAGRWHTGLNPSRRECAHVFGQWCEWRWV